MKDYYITSIEQDEAMPFVMEHMLSIGTFYDQEWTETSKEFIHWYGAQTKGEIKGVLGLMYCSSMPDDLIITGLYGCPTAIKILGDYVMGFPHKNKFGYIDVKNESWMLALMKRGFEVSPLVETDAVGNKIRLVQLRGMGV